VAGRSHKSPSEQAPRGALPGLSRRAASSWTVLAVFVVVVILSLWLHFVLALQIASTGRQIQIKTEELHKLDRTNAALMREVARAESPRALAARAHDLGYQPQAPIYLPLSRPVSQPGAETGETGAGSAAQASSPSVWDALAGGLNTWAQAKNTP
jgi:cell division protein FtsB